MIKDEIDEKNFDTRSLEEKIAIMQVAAAGGAISAKHRSSERWVTLDDPQFNWGMSDYKVAPSLPSIIENAADTTLNYTEISNKLANIERGKNLVDIRDYTSHQLRDSKNKIQNSFEDLNIQWNNINENSLAGTEVYSKLIEITRNDPNLLSKYIKEIQDTAKKTIQTNIKDEAMLLINRIISAQIRNLPAEKNMYTSNVPSKEDLKRIVSDMSLKLAEAYPKLQDKQVIELEKDGITMKLWKNLDDNCTLTVSYDLEKKTVGELPPIIDATNKSEIKINVVSVTLSEMNSAIAQASTEVIQKLTKNYEDLYQQIKEEVIRDLKGDPSIRVEENAPKLEVKTLKAEPDEKIKEQVLLQKLEASCVGIAEQVFDREFNKRVSKDNPEFKQIIRDIDYPIGYYYCSAIDENPEQLFGGYWAECHSPKGLYGWIRMATPQTKPKFELPYENSIRMLNFPYSYRGPSGIILYYVAVGDESVTINISNPKSTLECTCCYIVINGKVMGIHKNGNEKVAPEKPQKMYGLESYSNQFNLTPGDVLAIKFDNNSINGFSNSGDNSCSSDARIDIRRV